MADRMQKYVTLDRSLATKRAASDRIRDHNEILPGDTTHCRNRGAFPVSRGHIMKVVLTLGQAGFLRSQPGREGGFTLALQRADIRLGDVLRRSELDFQMVECLGPQSACPITSACRLPAIQAALVAFMSVMDRHTLADVMLRPADFLPQSESA